MPSVAMKAKSRSSARQALAAAIARHREAEAELGQKLTARARTSAQITEAELILLDRRRLLEEARERHVDQLEAAHDAGHNVMTAPALGVREARDAVLAAEDDLSTLRTLLERMDARLAGPAAEPAEATPEEAEAAASYIMTPMGLQPQYDLKSPRLTSHFVPASDFKPFDWLAATRQQVVKAIDGVVREHSDTTITEAVKRAQAAIAEVQAAGARLAALARHGVIGEHHEAVLRHLPHYVAVPTLRAWRDNVGAFRCEAENYGDPSSLGVTLPAMQAQEAAWDAALAALETNADAELPA